MESLVDFFVSWTFRLSIFSGCHPEDRKTTKSAFVLPGSKQTRLNSAQHSHLAVNFKDRDGKAIKQSTLPEAV
jgi:hypothetical protein